MSEIAAVGAFVATACTLAPVVFGAAVDRSVFTAHSFGFAIELADAFAPHIAVGGVVLVVLAMVLRLRLAAVLWIFTTAMYATPVLRDVARPDRGTPPLAADAVTLTVYSHNALYGTADAGLVLAQIVATDADVVVFQEYTAAFAGRVAAGLRVTHPHVDERFNTNGLGKAVFSRLPFAATAEPLGSLLEDVPNDSVEPFWQPHVLTVVETGAGPVAVVNVHLQTPLGPGRAALRRVQSEHLAAFAGSMETPAVLIGDFNMMPWSACATRLRSVGMVDAHRAAGSGMGITWAPGARAPLPVGARIDYCFSNARARAVSFGVLADTGSDHRPIVARLVIDPDAVRTPGGGDGGGDGGGGALVAVRRR